QRVVLIPHKPNGKTAKDYQQFLKRFYRHHRDLNPTLQPPVLVECYLDDASEFQVDTMMVRGERIGNFSVLRCTGPAVPNMLAALALKIRDELRVEVQIRLTWTPGEPVVHHLRYLMLGEGDTARLTRHIIEHHVGAPSLVEQLHRRPSIEDGRYTDIGD